MLLKFLLLILTFCHAQENEAEVDYYVDLITTTNQNALTYTARQNAYEYYSNRRRKNYGIYDFVVIGAGSGGSVAANRLSEIKNWNVLVLEAGTYGNNATDVPNLYGALAQSRFNWGFETMPQKNACQGMKNDICLFARGRGVGGTSLINGLVYSRGHKSDYEKLAKVAGDKRWGYDNVLRLFKKSENFVHNDPDAPYEPKYHAKRGYFRVEYHKPRSPQLNAFLEANKELGHDTVDYNANKLGASPSQLNTVKGRRLDSAKAFLEPVKNRKNLKILPESYVTNIRLNAESRRATGVEFSHRGQNYYVEAQKEVILCAGAVGSAQILMLSGIGPQKHLQDLGIDVYADLEVGSTFKDQPLFVGLNIRTNYTEPIKSLREYVKEFLKGKGPYAIPNSNQGVAFYESSYTKGTGVPDIEMDIIPANATGELSQKNINFNDQTYNDLWRNNVIPQSFLIYLIASHAQSFGTIRLKSKNPYEYPLIDPNLISDPGNRDINTLYEGIQLFMKLLQTKAFKSIDAKLQGGPLKACSKYKYLSKQYWFCALRQITNSDYHPVSTCPMGKDPRQGAVVDSKLKVFGYRNLRVADTSVFPFNMACHTNAPAVMVGEQLGDLVKETYQPQ